MGLVRLNNISNSHIDNHKLAKIERSKMYLSGWLNGFDFIFLCRQTVKYKNYEYICTCVPCEYL